MKFSFLESIFALSGELSVLYEVRRRIVHEVGRAGYLNGSCFQETCTSTAGLDERSTLRSARHKKPATDEYPVAGEMSGRLVASEKTRLLVKQKATGMDARG